MANIKSAQKRAKQSTKKRLRNVIRKSSIKTAVKKVLVALEKNEALETTKALLRDAEAQLARAKGKGVLHRKTAQRKISRLAKRVAAAQRAA